MHLAFVSTLSTKTVTGDATAHHKAFPRPMRLTLRVPKSKAHAACANTHDGVDSYMAQVQYRTDTYHTQNLEYLDRGYDFDEFGDIDNEFDGLTIVEPMSDADLWRFCTGYDVL